MTQPAQPQLPPEIARLSFEDALGELETLVKKLETGKATLDEAITDYEKGAFLKRHCEAKLQEAQGKIALVAEGGTAVKPFSA